MQAGVHRLNCSAGARCSRTSVHVCSRGRCRLAPARRLAAAIATTPLATSCAASEHDVDSWYSSGAAAPPQYMSPSIQVQHIQGKGRGVVATAPIQAGQLVMLAPPLAVIHSPGEQRPEPSQLVDLLLRGPATAANPWLDLLYNGTTKSTKSTPELRQQLSLQVPEVPVQQQQPQQPSAPASAGVEPSSSTSSGGDTALSSAGTVRISSRRNKRNTGSIKQPSTATHKAAAKQVAKVVAYNSYGEAHSDRAAAACRGVPAVGHVGLWPAFALLNHSCAPNTTHWVLGDLMVVRAVTDIAAGEELSISYVGRPQLMPWAPRAQELKRLYGFNCACPRCNTEEALYDRLGGLLQELDQQAQSELEPALRAAAAAGDVQQAEDVRHEAQAQLMVLYNSFRRFAVNPQQRRWCMASVCSCLEVVADADRLMGRHPDLQVASSKALLQAVEAVTLGSDLHVITAAQHAAALQAATTERLAAPEAASDAQERSRNAQRLRYGPVSDGLADRLAQLNSTLYDVTPVLTGVAAS